MQMSAAKPLELYTARKPDPKTGGKAKFWIGLKPPQPPAAWLVESAIAAMPPSARESFERIDRVNDPQIPAEKMEDHHVTFVAMIDQKYQTEEEFERIKAWIQKQEFTEDDLTPELDEKGLHKIDIVDPGRGVVIIRFKYRESERLAAARQKLAARVCTEVKWNPSPAHVSAAYCVKHQTEPYKAWLIVVLVLGILLKEFSADDDDQSAFTVTYAGLVTTAVLTVLSHSTAGAAAALAIIADHNRRFSWSLLHWRSLSGKSHAHLGRVGLVQWVALLLLIGLFLTGVKSRTRNLIENRAWKLAASIKAAMIMTILVTKERWLWCYANCAALGLTYLIRRRMPTWARMLCWVVLPIAVDELVPTLVTGVVVACHYFTATAFLANAFL